MTTHKYDPRVNKKVIQLNHSISVSQQPFLSPSGNKLGSINYSTSHRSKSKHQSISSYRRGSFIVPQEFKTKGNQHDIKKTSLFRAGIGAKAKSSRKWSIVGNCFFCFGATFHCLLSISALESTFTSDKEYNMDAATFGSLTTISFMAAMIAAILVPYFINLFDLYKMIIVAQIVVTIGQGLTVMSHAVNINGKINNLPILYIGRGFVGFGLGMDSVCIQALVGLWFRESTKKALAFALINNSIEVGISTALYILVPVQKATDSKLTYPLGVGVLWGVLSIHSALYMLYLEYDLSKNVKVSDKKIVLDTNFWKAVKIINGDRNQWSIWGVIIILFCGKGIVDTFSNEAQNAYVTLYNMHAIVADWCLSITAIVGLGFGALLGTIIGKMGQYSMSLIFATFLMTFGILLLACTGGDNGIKWFDYLGLLGTVGYVPWLATVLYSFGLEMFFIAGYSSLFDIIPLELIPIASSFVAILTYGSSMIGCWVFGILADAKNFSYSFFMLGVWSGFGFLWAIFVHINDGRNEKRLRKQKESDPTQN